MKLTREINSLNQRDSTVNVLFTQKLTGATGYTILFLLVAKSFGSSFTSSSHFSSVSTSCLVLHNSFFFLDKA